MRVNHNNRIFRGDFLKLSDKQKKMLQDTFLLKLMRGEVRDLDGRDVLEREHEFIQPLCLWGGGGFFIPENRGYYASGAWV